MERMDEFFARRIDGYEHQMLYNVVGCREAYGVIARTVPHGCRDILDLGCGTGLELDEIYKLFPDVRVTGIDMTRDMLDVLAKKHPEKPLRLICGDYFKEDLGINGYDCAVSAETMHHFLREDKISLYGKIFRALRDGGVYIECDYMAEDEETEKSLLLARENSPEREEGAVYHIDIPYTPAHQADMLLSAGFTRAVHLFRMGNTSVIAAYR